MQNTVNGESTETGEAKGNECKSKGEEKPEIITSLC